jgi:putative exporter of polyketide antibiotics
MAQIHEVLFNMQILYSIALGVWAAVIAGQNQALSGGYWGAVMTFVGLVAVTLLVGIVMILQGLRPQDGRIGLYLLYMAFLVVIMPGLFSMLRGRDDRSAAIAFALLALFNASVSFSMQQRGLVGPWFAS